MDDKFWIYTVGSKTLPGFVFWKAAGNSAAVKSSKILTGVAVVSSKGLTLLFKRVELTRNQHPRIFPVSEELCCNGVRWNRTMTGGE